ncbi:MAG: ATP synthase F0 subunit A, partial [Maioricimonas sp. JB049]
MILASGTFHHVYDFDRFELPFHGELVLPSLFGLQITKFMILQVVAALLTFWIFRGLSRRVRGGSTVSGLWWNFWEMLALYIRDDVVRPINGEPHAHDHGHDHGHQQGGNPQGTEHQHSL